MEHFSLLIVEDSNFVNDTLKELFTQHGHNCQQAFSLEETLHTLKRFTFDYIILDLHLPDAEEEELVKAVKDATETKIFVLTSENDQQVREIIFRYGIVDYFIKDDSFVMNVDAINKLMHAIPYNHKHTILAVDDSKLTQKHISLTLNPRSYTILDAYTAQEAQDHLANNASIDLIILDMELPDLHGSKLLKLFKVNPKFKHIPIIVLSGTISPDIVSMVIKAGANDYIEKPFNQESFLLKVSRLIEQVERDKELSNLNKELLGRVNEELTRNQAQQVAMLHQSKLAQMGEMISMIAHQWRQPLSAITSVTANLAFLNMQEQLNSKIIEKEIGKIDQYAQHLSDTITEFRNFFKTNNETTTTTLDEVISSVFDIISLSLEAKNINVMYEKLSDMPLKTFSSELKQVILNLIKNSEDALIEKEIDNPFIDIKIYKSGDSMIYEHFDNGGGIDEEYIDKIFDPYFSTKKNQEGTGLGLYMSKIIIEDHCHGEIVVKNYQDGTLFKLKIPAQI